MPCNILYHGDNLDVLRRHVAAESVDLIYLDPPFNSNQDYNVLFEEQDGSRSEAQIKAFDDTWRWDQGAARAYQTTVEEGAGWSAAGGRTATALRALRELVGESDMLAYLSMMAPRLAELHRVLKRTGSIYLHCDPTASHYLKALMDAVFGGGNFRREIIWRSGWVSGFKARTRNWVRNHDVLLYYVKDSGTAWTFNKELAYKPHEAGYERRGGRGNPLGVAVDDVWDEVALYSPWIKSFSQEKLGYMTQKPVTLLERIVKVSSNSGDTVLDPFCGCGTTIHAAQALGRRWIGIDVTHLAVTLTKRRLADAFAGEADYEVVSELSALPETEMLAVEARGRRVPRSGVQRVDVGADSR
jgi:site-specific DNA-methyltransferase (adenine-specific)